MAIDPAVFLACVNYAPTPSIVSALVYLVGGHTYTMRGWAVDYLRGYAAETGGGGDTWLSTLVRSGIR